MLRRTGRSGSIVASLSCATIWNGLTLSPLIAAGSDCRAVDETSLRTNMTQARGWAPPGDRLINHAPAGRWNPRHPSQVCDMTGLMQQA